MFKSAKASLTSILIYLGDAAHRRAVSSLIMALALHFGGVVMEVDHIDTLIGLLIPIAAAWSSRTPKIQVAADDVSRGG